ncbi:MAG: family 43 glycosylhydrolase [Kiritimatiellae bacterium]|nr:family 43 glycosylhydrolase [Kiritimatiellia bacterium]
MKKLISVFVLGLVSFGFADNSAVPCKNITFKPLQSLMRYGDTTRRGQDRPFAKDPTVIRHQGRYLMYYSVWSYDKEHLPANLSPKALIHWAGAIAESKDLVNWKRVCDIELNDTNIVSGGVAPCVKKFDGKIHMFSQGRKAGNGKQENVIWHATSEDGIHFVTDRASPAFVPNNAWSLYRAIDAEVYRVGDRMILMYATRERPTGKIQQLGMAWAPYGSSYSAGDWKEMSIEKPFFKPDLPWEMSCIEAPTVIYRKGIWYMFYAGAYNHERQQIGVAWSKDGVSYTRWRDTPVLPHGAEGSWNAWESGHPGIFQDEDGKVYLFYQGKATLKGDYQLSCLEVCFED